MRRNNWAWDARSRRAIIASVRVLLADDHVRLLAELRHDCCGLGESGLYSDALGLMTSKPYECEPAPSN
jgi:hypothetical protein